MLRAVYIALCELKSDFNDETEIKKLSQTVMEYAGLGEDTTNFYIKALKRGKVVELTQCNTAGKFGGVQLRICRWDELVESKTRRRIKAAVESNGRKRQDQTANNRRGLLPSAVIQGDGPSCNDNTKVLHTLVHSLSCNDNTKVLHTLKRALNAREHTRVRVQGATADTEKIIPPQFDEFWKLYPRHVGLMAARRKWEQICRRKDRPTLAQIVAALEKQRRTIQWQDKRYIPHPTTWLNQGRWLDEVDESDMISSTRSKGVSMGTGWDCETTDRYKDVGISRSNKDYRGPTSEQV